MKSVIEDIRILNVGDIIRFNDGDVGVVVKKGNTFLHDHSYVKIKYFYLNLNLSYNGCVSMFTLIFRKGLYGKKIGNLTYKN